jgi:hypothetical protein
MHRGAGIPAMVAAPVPVADDWSIVPVALVTARQR